MTLLEIYILINIVITLISLYNINKLEDYKDSSYIEKLLSIIMTVSITMSFGGIIIMFNILKRLYKYTRK